MKANRSTRALSAVIAAAILSSITGCSSAASPSQTESSAPSSSSQQASSAAAPSTAEESAPFELDILTKYHTSECPTEDNVVIKALEELTNTSLKITWIPGTAYDDKVNVTIASGDYPSLMLINGNGKPGAVEIEAVRAGMFWKVGDYIQDYEYLRTLDEAAVTAASIDGELWGMYRTRPLARDGFYYRTDWVEKLGLSAPKNLDELHTMLKMFVENDPDGNGVADTGGLAQESSLNSAFAVIGPFLGLPNQWDVVDGKVQPITFDDRYMEMLDYIKMLYDEGLMNRDFPTVSAAQRDELMSDKYGMAMTSIDKGQKSITAMQQLHPESNYTVQQVFADAPEQYIWARSGYDSKYYISTKRVKDEATVRRIMEYFNTMHSPEANNIIAYGLEGRHYDKVGDNEITISEEQSTAYLKEAEIIGDLGFRYYKNLFTVKDTAAYTQQVNDAMNNNSGLCRANFTLPFNSETYNEKGKDLDQIIDDANVKYVTGAIDKNGWLAEIERWKEKGGNQVIADYQAAYDAK